MKNFNKTVCLIMCLATMAALTACGRVQMEIAVGGTSSVGSSVSSATDSSDTTSPDAGVYTEFLLNTYDTSDDARICLKDIDGDGVEELLVYTHPTLEVYTFDGSVQKIGEQDFSSGTTRFLELESYPGIVKFAVGGGLEHYDYITVKNGQVVVEDIWKYNFSKLEDYPETIEISTDKALIEESKKAYGEDKDLEFVPLQPSVSN